MDLASLRNKTSVVRMEFQGEILRFTYNPNAYDDDCQRVLSNLTEQKDNTSTAEIFEKVITSWDLKDNGVQVPCTYDAFLMLPPFLRTKLLNALIEDEMELGKLNRSDNSSNQATRVRQSALVPIGTSDSSTSNGQEPQTSATMQT